MFHTFRPLSIFPSDFAQTQEKHGRFAKVPRSILDTNGHKSGRQWTVEDTNGQVTRIDTTAWSLQLEDFTVFVSFRSCFGPFLISLFFLVRLTFDERNARDDRYRNCFDLAALWFLLRIQRCQEYALGMT